jgi:hypothetical protein
METGRDVPLVSPRIMPYGDSRSLSCIIMHCRKGNLHKNLFLMYAYVCVKYVSVKIIDVRVRNVV